MPQVNRTLKGWNQCQDIRDYRLFAVLRCDFWVNMKPSAWCESDMQLSRVLNIVYRFYGKSYLSLRRHAFFVFLSWQWGTIQPTSYHSEWPYTTPSHLISSLWLCHIVRLFMIMNLASWYFKTQKMWYRKPFSFI